MKGNNFSVLLLSIVTLAFLLFVSKAYQNQALSFHFVDEEDNIVLGKYLLQGEKLYSNLFSHHQPIAYILSAGVSEFTNPNTLFLLIKRHREALILWTIVWGMILVLRFRLLSFLTLLIYEPLKIFILGNLFLSESLVVYPLAYVLSWIFTVKKVFRWEIIFLGFCLSLSALLLSPLWPVIGVLILFVLGKIRKERWGKLEGLWTIGGAVIPLIAVLVFISIPDYFFNAFYINFKYYIPMTSGGSLIFIILNAFASPFLALVDFQNGNATMQVTKILSLILILSSIFLMKNGNWRFPLVIFLILGLANIRFVPPGQESFSGFHIMPWFMALIVSTLVSVEYLWGSREARLVRWGGLGGIGVLFVLLGVAVFKESSATLFKPRDQALDFYINYSRQADFGTAIKIMKTPGEKLFIAPDEWLIYWQADISHASKMVNYYAWMTQVPEIKNPLQQIFAKNPPTYFYCDRCQFGYFGLEEFFNKYQRLKKDSQETNLMVLKEKLNILTPAQKDQLSYYHFTIF